MATMKRIAASLETSVVKPIRLRYLLYEGDGTPISDHRGVPLLIFLHGIGERGDNLELLRGYGPPMMADRGAVFPGYLLAPQCPEDEVWVSMLDELDALLAAIIRDYPIDTGRIWLTGLSSGGYGAWHWAERHPRAFAALVPICGGTIPYVGFPERIRKLVDLPIWAFHGEADDDVPADLTTELIEELKKAGGNPRYTLYPGVGHDSWTQTYANDKMWEWVYAQKNTGFAFRSPELYSPSLEGP